MTVDAKNKNPRRGRMLLFLVLGILLLAMVLATLWYIKVIKFDGGSFLIPCVFHEFTGLYCTGCGITRAVHFILNGQLYAGFRMNPLAVASFPFLAACLCFVLYRAYKRRPLPAMPTWLPWAIFAVIVVYTVARNLPWEPFNWLAPTMVSWARIS